MAPETLLLAAAVHLVTALSFAAVGRAILRRPTTDASRGPSRAAVLWWWSMGAYLAVQSLLTMLAAFGRADVRVFLVVRVVTVPLLCVAVWGLTYHLLYLFTGRRAAATWLALLYGVVGIAFLVASYSPAPERVIVTDWVAELEGTGEGALYRAVYVAVGIPPVLASLAYLSLVFRVQEPLQRYRCALLGGSILLWVASGLSARLSGGDLAKFVTLVVFGLGAALAVFLAYYPPRPVARRLGAA